MFIWTVGDVIGGFALCTALTIGATVGILRSVKQDRCKHASIFETSACDAVCRDCRKNLGFIGTWRQKHDT